MLDLCFHVEAAEAVRNAAIPLIAFKLRLWNGDPMEPDPAQIQTVALRCQIRIEPEMRRYGAGEASRLLDLFGEPERWGGTLRSLLWTHTSVIVPSFSGQTSVDLTVPCTYDLDVAAVKYFHALEDGDVPLSFLFSGTVFYSNGDGTLAVAPISWEKEAAYHLPMYVWNDMMEAHYPNSAWLCIRKDLIDRLHRFKSQRALSSWEKALEALLPAAAEESLP